MNSKTSPLAEAGDPSPGYSYPKDLALFVQDRWMRVPEPLGAVDLCPSLAMLEAFFSACYHASMVREEERPVTFRAILAENPHIRFYNNQRGYVRSLLTPDRWLTEYRVVPYVTMNDAPISTRASFVVEAGRAGAIRTDTS